jgi:hypothetical protein
MHDIGHNKQSYCDLKRHQPGGFRIEYNNECSRSKCKKLKFKL